MQVTALPHQPEQPQQEASAASTVGYRIIHKLDGSTERVPLKEQDGSVQVTALPQEPEQPQQEELSKTFHPVQRITIKLDGTKIVEQLDENGDVLSTSAETASPSPSPPDTSDPCFPVVSLSSLAVPLPDVIQAISDTVRSASRRATVLRREAKSRAALRPKVIVLTGPAASKTALANCLQQKGCELVPQASSTVVEALTRLLGQDGQASWRTAFSPAFDSLIDRVGLATNSQLAASSNSMLVIDSVLDTIGNSRHQSLPVPGHLRVEDIAASAASITHVFVLDQLASERSTAPEPAHGLSPEQTESQAVSSVLFDVYAELGCNPRWLPVGTAAEQARQILDVTGASHDLD